MFPKYKFNVIYAIIVLMIIGFFFRIYFLGFQSFWIDEAFSVNAASGILEHGYPLLDSGKVYSRDILNTYLIAGFMGIFGETHFAFPDNSTSSTITLPLSSLTALILI